MNHWKNVEFFARFRERPQAVQRNDRDAHGSLQKFATMWIYLRRLKTHAIFILEMNQRNERACRPPLCLCICQSLLTAQLQLLQIGAREPRSRLSVSASLGKGGGARRSEAGKMPPTPRKLESKRAAEGGKISNLQGGVCAPLTRAY